MTDPENDEDPGICVDCNYPLTLVRPGKAQCDYCELLEVYEEEVREHSEMRRTLTDTIDDLVKLNDQLQGVIASQRNLLCEHGLAEYGN